MSTIPENLEAAFTDVLLALADDKLMTGHRNSDWTGLAPILEEDIAFSSIAQDELAHAAAIYELLAADRGVRADDIALGRNCEAYRCAGIVEIPDDFNWAMSVARRFLCDHYDMLRLQRLAASSHVPLAALAGRLLAEERVHVHYIDEWVLRLGTGNADGHQRLQSALDTLAPHAAMLSEPVDNQAAVEAAGLYPTLTGDTDHFDQWVKDLQAVTTQAGLTLQFQRPSPESKGGRRGEHTEHLQPLLDEMCEVFRLEPNAAW